MAHNWVQWASFYVHDLIESCAWKIFQQQKNWNDANEAELFVIPNGRLRNYIG